MVSLTAVSAPASSPTERSTPTRPASRVERPQAARVVIQDSEAAAPAATTSLLSTMDSRRTVPLTSVSRATTKASVC